MGITKDSADFEKDRDGDANSDDCSNANTKKRKCQLW